MKVKNLVGDSIRCMEINSTVFSVVVCGYSKVFFLKDFLD